MNFTDIFIRRPVFASVLNLLLILVGLIAYSKLTLREFPAISTTVVTVTTTFPGASADLMEGFVTTPLENVLASVDGIDYMTSTSSIGRSIITLNFKLGYDINVAIADVSAKVSSKRSDLPNDIDDPVIEKQDPNATPILYIAFNSEKMSSEAITDYLQRSVKPVISTINGVGEARIFGAREYAMRIWLNPNRMANFNVTASDIINSLNTNNPQSPTGRLSNDLLEFDVLANTSVNTEKQFDNLIIKKEKTNLTRIKDVGKAELGAANTRLSVDMNGKRAVVIGVIPRSDANPLDVSKEVKQALTKIKNQFPQDLNANIVWDVTIFIAESLREVRNTLIEATVFVLIVIFLFLGSVRMLFIPMVTIPLSLIGVCFLLFLMGFSINTMTLLAMVLAIGMVVDDAIVVSENIHRHVEQNMKVTAAAIVGAREIQFAIIAMTLTLAAVYAPIGFLSGLTGALYKEFAFTLASAVIISGFTALTLSPMLCSKIMKARQETHRFEKLINDQSNKFRDFYKRRLHNVLKFRFLLLPIIVILFVVCVLLYMTLSEELAPAEDEGAIVVAVKSPSWANLSYTEKYTQQIANIFNRIPEKINYGIINGYPEGVDTALSFLVLQPWSLRQRDVSELITALMPKLWAIPGIKAFPLNPYKLPGSSGLTPIEFVLTTSLRYEQLNAVLQQLLNAVHSNPHILNVDTDLIIDKPQFNVIIDRNKAGFLGVSTKDIGDTLNVALGEPTPSRFDIKGRSYDVIPQLFPEFRKAPDALHQLNVRTADNELVQLANVASIQPNVAPKSLNHFQQLRSAKITASVGEGYTLGQALNFIEQQAQKILPKEIQYDFSGESRQFRESRGAITFTFIFALIFIYLLLAGQFESFADPFIVMISVLLSTVGGLFILNFIGATINIYTGIGLVTLIGLISKHGILIVEFANQLQYQGLAIHEAVIEAASIRLRPILMTTGAMVLGAMPLAFARGAGAISRQQIGWVIIAGMLFGTAMTLFVVPTMYTYLATKKKKFSTGDEALDQTMSL